MGPSTFGTIPALMWNTSFQCVFDAVPNNVSSDASLLLLICILCFFPNMMEQKHHVPFWLKFWHAVGCFHQFESHLALAMTGSGQFMASSCTGCPYSLLAPKCCSLHSVHLQVWFSKQFKWLLMNGCGCFPRVFKIWFIDIIFYAFQVAFFSFVCI